MSDMEQLYTLHISRLCLYGYHGVMPQEQVVGANFYVSVEAQVRVGESALVDDCLDGTVSYAGIIDVVRAEMSRPSRLLEHVAYRMAVRLKSAFPRIESVTIRVDKENPPCGVLAQEIGVSVTV